MAIGAVVSNRNFGSFIGSERAHHPESAAQYVNQNVFQNKLRLPNGRYSLSGYRLQSYRTAFGASYGIASGSKLTHVEGECPLSFAQRLCGRSQTMNHRQIVTGICQCRLISASSHGSCNRRRKPSRLSFVHGQNLKLKHAMVNGFRADYKSDEYDLTEIELESLVSSEGASEAVLVGGIDQTKPWWQQFPKRWVMVLLCFGAFLLCNMDRVNMSIAILPMSKEFNWNSATVGLIQSSFFWGYLLTQIVGGIWADKIGGKLVLGFGVVWWSLATVLTPIAARIGLPFLLVVRAFMGIGEVWFFFDVYGFIVDFLRDFNVS